MISGVEPAHLAPRTGAIFLEGRLPMVAAPMARELGLHDHQVVAAKAQAQAQGSGWSLELPGGQRLELPRDFAPALRVASGDTLLFRVQLQADGSILLRPLAQPSATAAADPLWPERSQQLLHRPPNPVALQQLLQPASLDQLLQQARSVVPELAAGLQAWMRLRPSMAQLTPARLQQLLMQGGWMTEALLAQGRGAELVDLKSSLRSLLRGLGGGATETRALLQDALDDIESRQLQASHTDAGKEWAISMVLPFVDAHPVQVRMSWRPAQDDSPSRFTLQLHTTSPELGDLWLQSQVSDLADVDLVMWADREDVARRAQARSASLADELDSAGLRMIRLQVIHGRRPDSTETPWGPPDSGSVVDVAT